MFEIEISPKALRQLKKLSDELYAEIISSIETLALWPDVLHVKSLTNHEYEYRLKVGHYRVLFDVYSSEKVILVREVKKRDENTY